MEKLTEYISLAVAIHGVALVVVNLTPTPRDNEALDGYSKLVAKVYRAIEILAGIWGPKVKR
jgi:hypothetical protein